MAQIRESDVIDGKYRVERGLGEGGMGFVVAAWHLQLDEMVALKFIRSGAKPETSVRFLREAKATAKLKGPHVARVYDVDALETGEPYIVMEYLEGTDLGTLAKTKIFPIAEACDYVLQACDALAEAHALGIVHRDVKLGNLFLTKGPDGEPFIKVLDFGISKFEILGEHDVDVTNTTAMLGSPRFMSPEQMDDARKVDARSDIWSLGVVLYRLVTGKAPFEAPTLMQLLAKVMNSPHEPLSTHLPDAPLMFGKTIDRCLEKQSDKRFDSIAEFAQAIAPFTSNPDKSARAAQRISAMLGRKSMPPPPIVESVEADVRAEMRRELPSLPPGASQTDGASTMSTPPDRSSKGLSKGVALALIASGVVAILAVYSSRSTTPRELPPVVAREVPVPAPEPPAPPVIPSAAVSVSAPSVPAAQLPPAPVKSATPSGRNHKLRKAQPSAAPPAETPVRPTEIPSTRD